MNSQTSLVAEQCRIQSWAMQIKDCQNRPKNMTVDEWCLQNNITKANYYYRLKRVRQTCLDSMESTPTFVELPAPETKSANECTTSSGTAAIIRFQFELDPYDKNTLFLFCGKRSDRIKGLLWEGDGFLLLYKRLDNGAFNWPRSESSAMEITDEQYRMLMKGLEVVARHPIEEMEDPPRTM